MLASFDETTAALNDEIDIKPDISVLCGNVSTTPTMHFPTHTPTADSVAAETQVDHKPHACIVCRNLSFYDAKLHQLQRVVMREFDVTKLVYPTTSQSQADDTDIQTDLNENMSDKPYICIECGNGLRTISQWNIHTARHYGVKQRMIHSALRYPGR